MFVQYRNFDEQQLARFRSAQRASFGVLEGVAAGLKPGISERAAAIRLWRCEAGDKRRLKYWTSCSCFSVVAGLVKVRFAESAYP